LLDIRTSQLILLARIQAEKESVSKRKGYNARHYMQLNLLVGWTMKCERKMTGGSL
jgi:hypothetical protein